MSNEPRKHHYVPQGYLKFFAIKQKKVWKTTVIDKVLKKSYVSNIEDVAVARDYNRDTSKNDEFYWEKYYSQAVESYLPKIIGNVIAITQLTQDKKCVLNNDLKSKLARIICIQMLRTPTMRNRNFKIAKQASLKVINDFKKEYYNRLSSSQKRAIHSFTFNENFYKQNELPFINDETRLTRFENFLFERNWVIYRNPFSKQVPFITSDNPVTFYNYGKKSSELKDNGLLVDDTVINFPLNENLMLCLYAPTHWMLNVVEYNNCVIDLQWTENDLKYVVLTNDIQIKQCYRQAFTKTMSTNIINGFINKLV